MDSSSASVNLHAFWQAKTKRIMVFLVFSIWMIASFGFQFPDEGLAQALEETAQLRFANFSSDAPSFHVYIDGQITTVNPIEFGSISDWLEIDQGTYRVAFIPVGSAVADALIGPSELTITADVWNTVLLLGSYNDDNLFAQILNEDFRPVVARQMRVGFVHAIDGLPPVNVLVAEEPILTEIMFAGGENDRVFRDADVVDTSVGVVDVQIRRENEEEPIVTLGDIELFSNQNTLLALIGTPDNPQVVRFNTTLSEQDEDVDAQVADLGSGTGFLRFAHFSSGTPDIGVYIDSALSDVSQLSFAEVTEYVEVPAGIYTIDMAPVNTSLNDRVIGPIEVAVSTGSSVTIAAVGTLANDTLKAQVFFDEDEPESTSRAVISVFHAIPGLGPVDVIVDDVLQVGLLGFPGSQGTNDGLAMFELVLGLHDFRVVLSEDPGRVLFELDNVRLVSDRRYLLTLVLAEPPFLLTTTEVGSAEDATDEP